MSVNWSQYTLAELRERHTTVFREGGGSRPDVFLIEIDGEKAVLKDQNAADRFFALFIGPLLNWRETAALKRLEDNQAIPKLLAKPCSRSFLMTHHESQQITKADASKINWPSFFEKLETSVQQMHSQGIAHNDLRNPTNTLITPQGEPILVDLVAYFSKGARWNFIKNWLFFKFCQVDASAITKLKSRFAPELVQENDIQAEQIAGQAGMAARGFGQWIRRISKRLLTNESERNK